MHNLFSHMILTKYFYQKKNPSLFMHIEFLHFCHDNIEKFHFKYRIFELK